MVEGTFEQTTTALGFLRSILGRYPFSIGFIREILQNAADAGASKLVLVLDRRRHPASSIHEQDLFGPAFLAFNDALFVENDWHALQYAYESSKADDSSKIGKYGVGFRSVFHVTDCPQIISGKDFAMFDPCKLMGSTGFRKDLSTVAPSDLLPFGCFAEFFSGEGFHGTVIRCPLRSKPSQIASKVVQAGDISDLFQKFITQEIDISLLFLRNIENIELHEVDDKGSTRCLATLSATRSSLQDGITEVQTQNVTTKTTTFANPLSSSTTNNRWSIIHSPFPTDEAIKFVSKDFPGDATSILKHHKLSPNISIAFPQEILSTQKTSGRLFTFLPLPIFTGFPVHIHGLFALTESRQNLRNPQEIGIVDGSDDQMLIRWNRLLFDHYIPQAWKIMLESVVASGKEIDILALWPPRQGSATSGEAVYWQSLPYHLLTCLAESTSSTWPRYIARKSPSTSVEYVPLDLLITAEPSISINVLDALTLMGLKLHRPPLYIHDLIKNTNKFRMLTPEVAHDALIQVEQSVFQSISKENQAIVLEYLLSTQNVLNIVGLPFITLSSRRIISLSSKDPETTSYTMLNKLEYEIFGDCDENAIPLQNFSFKVVDILRNRGPNHLNIENLDVRHIVNYLSIYPNKMGLDLSMVRIDQPTIRWLSKFWVWMGTYEKKAELFTKIQHLYLLPSTQGLRMADRPLFRALGEHPTFIDPLSTLGISFLDREVQQSAHTVIESFDLLKRITDVDALIDLLPDTVPPAVQAMPLNSCLLVLKHLGTYAHTVFTEFQIKRLKLFPIFPRATFPSANRGIVIENTSIPDGVSLLSIETPGPSFLPSLPGRMFIQLNKATPFLDYFEWTVKRSSVMDVLELTVDNFLSQEDYVQAAALEHILQRRHAVPPVITEALHNLPFVSVKDGSRRRPIDVVNPKFRLAELYEESPERRAQSATEPQRKIVNALQTLDMLQRDLTLDIIQDRINFISESTSANTINISRSLISLIISSRLDYSNLEVPPNKRWLPTDQGLMSSSECRDASSISRSLFDRVLATLEPFKIPSSFKHALGWDDPLPINILIQQLQCILEDTADESTFSKITDVLKELSSRDCTTEHLGDLKTAISGKKWVPTTDHQLTELQNAVLQAPILESGFHQALCPDLKMRNFFERMGCTNKPTIEAIVMNLNALQTQPISLNIVNTSLNLLRSLPESLDPSDLSLLLVPDETHCLRPFDDVYFNDIGDRASLIPSESKFIAHESLEESLAFRLGLRRLGLKYEEFGALDIDMGQDIVTTIRNNLKHYTDQQIITEFLANAIDAKATEFAVLVNKYCLSEEESSKALSEKMKTFCRCPSLVIHNDSKFTEEDFIGILRTGIGGKDGNPETIGHFGLGALTMFHVTELAIIVSNENVLFLDPSKTHLPVRDKASVKLPLNHVRNCYPSHLQPVDGLFGFEIFNNRPYEGTLFILPLRVPEHVEGSANYISRQIYSIDFLEEQMLQIFRRRASSCFLFTTITKIVALTREDSNTTQIMWSFSARRVLQEDERETGCLANEITITKHDNTLDSRWRVATKYIEANSIPQEILSSLANYRVRIPVILGLAFLLEDGSHESRSFGFFSTLPLGIETSLPCHVMASFLLSSDRRSIRLDEYGTESRFNVWLLSNALPRLYLFLLQVSLQFGDNKEWWPGRHRGKEGKNDTYSSFLINSFYSEHLRESARPVFYNKRRPEHPLIPQQIVLSGEEPPNIEQLLLKLACETVIRPSKDMYHLMTSKAKLELVSPSFVRSVIMQAPSFIFSEWDFKIIEDCIVYLLGKNVDTSKLLDLTIIPLEDETFGTFQDRSNPDSECYYIWIPHKSAKKHNFPTQKFVHPNLKPKVRETLLKTELNVISLDTPSMVRFIGEIFPAQGLLDLYRVELSSRISSWIYNFWESWPEYVRLGLSSDDISSFPLVPTVRTSYCTSLASLTCAHSLFVEGDSEQSEDIRYILDRLDINVVRQSSNEELPPSLYNILRGPDYPVFNIRNVLNALYVRHHTNNFSELFHECDRVKQRSFAEWARNDLTETIPVELQPVALQLPIWVSASKTLVEPDLLPATDIYMLPEGLQFDTTARFMVVCVAEYGSLRYVNGPKLSYVKIQERLHLPLELSISDLPVYRRFLELWLPRLYSESISPLPIPIPNGDRMIHPSDALYARDDLFITAFGSSAPNIIHQEFGELEPFLYRHGLKTESQLDVDMFSQCASAFESSLSDPPSVTPEEIKRANDLFIAYGFSLPMCIRAEESQRWSELDDLCFIPREMTRRRLLPSQNESVLGLDIPDNVINLSVIVSPLDLVRKEFEAVAWTQRGTFATQPNQRVILAYPSLGRPSITEVVAHLRFLSSVTELHHRTRKEIVIHDLEASYRFLDDPSHCSDDILHSIKDEKIFLNVNDPNVDPNEWNWDPADELVFDTHDVDHSIRHVRDFLLPFRRLLKAAGALQIHYPEYPVSRTVDTSENSKLVAIRSGFQELRESNILTDILFLTTDDDEEGADPPRAHRSFLAVNSEYFSDLFTKGYNEGKDASTTQPVKLESNHSRESVQVVLDYIYKDECPNVRDIPLILVLDIFRLSEYWKVTGLFDHIQKEIAVKLLSPQSLDEVRDAAENIPGADMLFQACIEYEEKNPALMAKFREIRSLSPVVS